MNSGKAVLVSTIKVTGSTAVTSGPGPVLVGNGAADQLRVLVANIGLARVWLGNRDMIPPAGGIPLSPGETYTHDGNEALYAALGPFPNCSSSGVESGPPVGVLSWVQQTRADSVDRPPAAIPWTRTHWPNQ